MIRKLFEGQYKYAYWSLMNKLFGPAKGSCLCTMREECQVCWTLWQSRLKPSMLPENYEKVKAMGEDEKRSIEQNQIFK